jgi:hypothetical protein
MISKKTAIKLTRESESIVYTSKDDIAQLIYMHSQLGFSELEVFVTKELAKKCIPLLEKKGFYTRETFFKSIKDESRLHISWISNL